MVKFKQLPTPDLLDEEPSYSDLAEVWGAIRRRDLEYLEREENKVRALVQCQLQLEQYRDECKNTKPCELFREMHLPVHKLEKNLVAVSELKPDESYVPHHIIPGKGHWWQDGLVAVRLNMHMQGIGINDPLNGAWLPRDKKYKGAWSTAIGPALEGMDHSNYEKWIVQKFRLPLPAESFKRELGLVRRMLTYSDYPLSMDYSRAYKESPVAAFRLDHIPERFMVGGLDVISMVEQLEGDMETMLPFLLQAPVKNTLLAPAWKEGLTTEFKPVSPTSIKTPDISIWEGNMLGLLLSAKAYNVFRDRLASEGEFLPIIVSGEQMYIFNCLSYAKEDESLCIRRYVDGSRAVGITTLFFDDEDLAGRFLFKSKLQGSSMLYCSSSFKMICEEHGLEGLRFDENLVDPF